jgi:signal transduction histidine kinase
MQRPLNAFSRRYAAGLQKFLQGGAHAQFGQALQLGRRGLALHLETLQMARIHDLAVAHIQLTESAQDLVQRAEAFFSEAIAPLVGTHRVAQESRKELQRLNVTLNRRTLELAATNRSLQEGIAQRKGVEAALKRSASHHARLLRESVQLQSELRRLSHRVLAVQEDERQHFSRKLQNEIAQTLLGINVRLVSLKQEAKINTRGFRSRIASTQRLVVESARSVRRVAREFTHS